MQDSWAPLTACRCPGTELRILRARTRARRASLLGDGDPQVGGGDRRRVLARVLLLEQGVELGLQVGLAAVLGRGRERVHGRAVVVAEDRQQLGRRTRTL